MNAAQTGTCKVGEVIDGRYRTLRVIGQGGMGTVFLAEHTLIARRVAVKVLHPDLAADAEIVEGFMQEARIAGTLGHPNIVESTDMGFLRGELPYIVFEYLEGVVLTDEIYRVGGLSTRRAVRIARQIASALGAAHAAGLIHRDLKSDNVVLTDRDGQPDHAKVLDFGISRFHHREVRPAARERIAGTPEFMAPEQITDPDAVDARTDVFALGVVLYEMLAARRPFAADDPRALMTEILEREPAPIARPDVPHGLQELIRRMLAKRPDDRPRSMADVDAALEAFTTRAGTGAMAVVSLPVTATPTPTAPVGTDPSPLPPPGRRARRRGAWAALAAALVLGGAAAAWMASRDRGAHPPAPPAPIAAAQVTAAPPATEPTPPTTPAAPPEVLDPPAAAPPVEPVEPAPAAAPEPIATSAADRARRERLARRGGASTGAPAVTGRAGSPPAVETAPPRLAPAPPAPAPAPATPAQAPAPVAAPPVAPPPVAPPPVAPPPASPRPAPAPAPAAPAVKPGVLDPDGTRATVRAHLGEIRTCHQRARLDVPNMRGTVTLRIKVGPTGAVREVAVKSTTLDHPGVEACMMDAVRGWTFPRPTGGVAGTVDFPFVLK